MTTRWVLYKKIRSRRQMCGVFHDLKLAEQVKGLQKNAGQYVIKKETYSAAEVRKSKAELERFLASLHSQKGLYRRPKKQTRPCV
jgi:hypothetical protein